MVPYTFPQNQKTKNFNFSKKNHGICFLGQKRLLVDFMPPGATINATAYFDMTRL
jgi:hypothetical protein